MRRLTGLALISVAWLTLADAELPAQQPSQGSPATQPAPTATLSPAEQEQLRAAAERLRVQLQQMSKKTPLENLHDLLDQVLTGAPLPEPYKSSFLTLFTPHGGSLHQVVNEVSARVRKQLTEPNQPRSSLEPFPPVVQRVRWAETKLSPNEQGSPHWLVASGRATGVQSVSGTQGIPDNAGNVTVKMERWLENDEWVTNMDADSTEWIFKIGEADASTGSTDRARVKRCPTADGVVPGQSEWGSSTMQSAMVSGRLGKSSSRTHQDLTAEGHVGEDARVKDVVVRADTTYEERTVATGSDGQPISGFTIVRWTGTATFDPHGSGDPPLQLTGCWGNKGALPVDWCLRLGNEVLVAFVSALRHAYLLAEALWNFEISNEYGSECVAVKFTPRTSTVRGKPSQSVKVQAELLAVKGNQPTWGRFVELEPLKGDGDIQANGTPTTPETPAQLIYTAPSQPWPPAEPPGFAVVKATSRAGAYQREKVASQFDLVARWEWFLAPVGLRLSIHERTEINFMLVSSLSEITFPMDLVVNQQSQVVGQAMVQREGRQQVAMGGCVGVDHWMEGWQASGMLDEKTNTLAIKLRFDASPRQGTSTCKGPGLGSDNPMARQPGAPDTRQHTAPGFRSDAFRTPLDHFILPITEGATQHFEIPFGPAKHIVDVTLMTGQGSRCDAPQCPQ
jgi:hypothetical protein